MSAGAGFFAALLGAGALAAAAWWAFAARGVWLPMVPPLAGVAASYTLVNAYRFAAEERERRRVHGMFGRCVSKEVVDQILNYEGDIPLGGARQEATLLFTDIRGFTGMSETMAPEDVVALLNEYFEAMTTIILDHGGTIDKFMGDAIMAVFGAPIPRDDHAERCVQAAVEMRKALRSLQARWEAEGKPRFDTGIGINTGQVLVGNIGSARRMEYTAIGDAVNLASRIEGLTKEYGGGILISEATYERVRDVVEAQPLGAVPVRGKARPVQLYRVLGLRGDGWRDEPGG